MNNLDTRFPEPEQIEQVSEVTARCELRVPEDSVFFDGHFPNNPILPGVAQIQWADHYGQSLLPVQGNLIGMEVIKFKNVIMPGDQIWFDFSYSTQRHKVTFSIYAGDTVYSSGRLVYSQ